MNDETNYDYAQAIAKQEVANQNILSRNPFTITLPYDASVFAFINTIPAVGVVEGDTIIVSIGSFLVNDENAYDLLDVRSINAVAGTNNFDLTINFSTPTVGIINLNWRKI